MPYEIKLVEQSGYFLMTLLGELTIAEHDEFRTDVVKKISETGFNRLLIDASRASPKMSVFDDFKYTSSHLSRLPFNLRTAIVHGADETERYKFIENVAQNRGVNIRVFANVTVALSWLNES